MTDDVVALDICLPLPLDIVSTLTSLVGAAYPGASMDMRHGRDDRMRMLIPEGQRHVVPLTAEQVAAAKQARDAAQEAMLHEARAEVTALSTPDEVKYRLGFLASRFFADHPDAVNYLEVEMDVHDKDTKEAFVLTVRRAAGRTPHRLRIDAETRVRELEARIAELEATQ